MRSMLLGCNQYACYSGLGYDHRLINKRIFALEKTSLTRENMNDKSRIRAAANSKAWHDLGGASFCTSHSRRQKEALLADCVNLLSCILRSLHQQHYGSTGRCKTKMTGSWLAMILYICPIYYFWACLLAHEHKHYSTVSSPVLSLHLKWQTEKTMDKATKMIKHFLL